MQHSLYITMSVGLPCGPVAKTQVPNAEGLRQIPSQGVAEIKKPSTTLGELASSGFLHWRAQRSQHAKL